MSKLPAHLGWWRSDYPDVDWDRLWTSYELVGVPGLPWSAVRGLLDAGIGPDDAARLGDEQLLAIKGVGPVAVIRLRGARHYEGDES